MTFRRAILVILLIVLSVLLVYNSYIAPLFVRGYNQMGMGMHGRMWRNYYNANSYIDFRIIILLIVVIAAVFLFDMMTPNKAVKKCGYCGYNIDNDRWGICPMCGKPVAQRKDGTK